MTQIDMEYQRWTKRKRLNGNHFSLVAQLLEIGIFADCSPTVAMETVALCNSEFSHFITISNLDNFNDLHRYLSVVAQSLPENGICAVSDF